MQDRSLPQTARDFVANYWGSVRDRAESRNELAYMSSHHIELLAADCGLTPGQFRSMMLRGPHAADELAKLMKALVIDDHRLKARSRRKVTVGFWRRLSRVWPSRQMHMLTRYK